MAAKKRSTQAKLDELHQQTASLSAAQLQPVLKLALQDRSNFVAARAAEICGDHLIYELIPDLLQAYERFLDQPLKTDKTCAAKRAIVRALYHLDLQDATFFRRGLKYIQSEPVYGGHVDTAVELRCTCGLGVAATSDARAVIDVLELLYDREPQARMGAAKALECTAPFEAEIVLRQKIIGGDDDPEVIGQCFASLLKIQPDAVEFVSLYLDAGNNLIRELALLTLGECRQDSAVEILVDYCERLSSRDPLKLTAYKALAMHRHNAALDYLKQNITEDDPLGTCYVLEALSVYQHRKDIADFVGHCIKQCRNRRIVACYRTHWLGDDG